MHFRLIAAEFIRGAQKDKQIGPSGTDVINQPQFIIKPVSIMLHLLNILNNE